MCITFDMVDVSRLFWRVACVCVILVYVDLVEFDCNAVDVSVVANVVDCSRI